MLQIISMKQLEAELMRGTVMTLLDVRSSEEYQKGAIRGAVNISEDELGYRMREIDKTRPVFVYCAHGSSSLRAARLLDESGYHAKSCAGGLASYRGRFFEVR